jgi:hypothetical protein
METISRRFHVLLLHMIAIFFSRLLKGFICSDTIAFAAYHCRETQEPITNFKVHAELYPVCNLFFKVLISLIPIFS